jgi:protein phosphatase
MTVCPTCQTSNRAGAKFCSICGTLLPEGPRPTAPLTAAGTHKLPSDSTQVGNGASKSDSSAARGDTQPLNSRAAFAPRPAGALFAGRFRLQKLVFSNSAQISYQVTAVDQPGRVSFTACPDPACGAVHAQDESAPESFCTACGKPLGENRPELVLTERLSPWPEVLARMAALNLSHSNVRAPLAAFTERVAGTPRYCLVTPLVAPLREAPAPSEALGLGVQLADGLDYLHLNGITFNGMFHQACLGKDHTTVWSHFEQCSASPETSEASQAADVRSLAALLFFWLSGKTQFQPDASLGPEVNSMFQKAFASPGFASAAELKTAVEQALQAEATAQVIDHQLGRRTHVGMQRTLNEDSVFTWETTRILKSVSRPLCVVAVADGMGGHAAGEVASGAIVSAIAERTAALNAAAPPDYTRWLRETVEAANLAVHSLRQTSGTDMGSTLVIAVIDGSQATLTHAGDSRIYRLNPSGIEQLTVDHSLVERLIATHQITRDEARHHPQRNVIYRTIGDKPHVDLEIEQLHLAAGDRLLLCSDGLSGMVEDRYIHEIVMNASSPQAACETLVAAANAAGGEDNISAVIVAIVAP